ncbi:polyprotein [Bienertia sinuspersici]
MLAKNRLGLGGVTRDNVGDVVVAICVAWEGSASVETGEAMAMRHALRISMEIGFERFEIETDNMKLYSHLMKGKTEASMFGSILDDISFLVGVKEKGIKWPIVQLS